MISQQCEGLDFLHWTFHSILSVVAVVTQLQMVQMDTLLTKSENLSSIHTLTSLDSYLGCQNFLFRFRLLICGRFLYKWHASYCRTKLLDDVAVRAHTTGVVSGGSFSIRICPPTVYSRFF